MWRTPKGSGEHAPALTLGIPGIAALPPLTDQVPPAPQKKALQAALRMRFQSTKNSNRCALKGNGGWELNFGWSETPQRFPRELRDWIKKHDHKHLYTPVRLFVPTLQQHDKWIKFKPLVRRMDALFRKHARHYWLTENQRFRSRTFDSLQGRVIDPSMERALRLFVRKRVGSRYSLIAYYRERLVDKVDEGVAFLAARSG